MAKSIWNKDSQEVLLKRLSSLTENSIREWGSMDVSQMLKHIDIAYKNALGEVHVNAHPLAFAVSFKPVRHTILYALPFQKNLLTASEYKVEGRYNFETIYAEFLRTFQKTIQLDESASFGKHPLFGNLNRKEWGALLYKHLDHHLKQFGV